MKTKTTNTIPSPDECVSLLQKVGCSERVICHCKAVYEVAVKLAERTDADMNLVKAGALLHDIGRSKTHKINHGIVGGHIAKEYGLSSKLVRIIETHIGAGLTPTIAESLGLPPRNLMPETLEEKIVCHADNLIDDCSRQNIEVEVKRALDENHKEYAIQLVNLHKEISDIIGMDANNV